MIDGEAGRIRCFPEADQHTVLPFESDSLRVGYSDAHAPSLRAQGKGFTTAGVAQVVERLICNQQVGGSNPFASSNSTWVLQPLSAGSPGVLVPGRGAVALCVSMEWLPRMGGFPSGQREQTVNLSAYAFEGSNPSPPK